MSGEGLQNFSAAMIQDAGFKAEKREALTNLFINKDINQSGFLTNAEAMAFIGESVVELTGQNESLS